VLALLAVTIGRSLVPTVGAQDKTEPSVTEAERREAQELAVAFTKRLSSTLDFSTVMDELFLPDAAERYVAEQKSLGLSSVTLNSGIFLDAALLDTAKPEDWRRLYVASSNFLLLGLLHLALKKTNFENIQASDLYPLEVAQLLNKDPMLSNLIEMKGAAREFKTAAQMRDAAFVLERANALVRKHIPRKTDLETTVIRMTLGTSPEWRVLDSKKLEKARSELLTPRLDIANSDSYGFAKGTRTIWVSTFAMMDILLVRRDGKLRIVWAQPMAD
jgi:hypothetical protein